MEKYGYKALVYPMLTRYGQALKEGSTYEVIEPVHYNKYGFHFCRNMEDTLRYVDGFSYKIDICKVIGSGSIDEYYDDYYGYYDMYCASIINIIKRLSSEEIINLTKKMSSNQIIRFISGYKLTYDELQYFLNSYSNDISILTAISYYQLNNKDAYVKQYK